MTDFWLYSNFILFLFRRNKFRDFKLAANSAALQLENLNKMLKGRISERQIIFRHEETLCGKTSRTFYFIPRVEGIVSEFVLSFRSMKIRGFQEEKSNLHVKKSFRQMKNSNLHAKKSFRRVKNSILHVKITFSRVICQICTWRNHFVGWKTLFCMWRLRFHGWFAKSARDEIILSVDNV